jgi:hypothetical protein
MTQLIHEIADPFDVNTPLGSGVAMFLIAGSIHANPQFIVRLYESGKLRVVDMLDIEVAANPSWDVIKKPET